MVVAVTTMVTAMVTVTMTVVAMVTAMVKLSALLRQRCSVMQQSWACSWR
jgi:hypothetical protein